MDVVLLHQIMSIATLPRLVLSAKMVVLARIVTKIIAILRILHVIKLLLQRALSKMVSVVPRTAAALSLMGFARIFQVAHSVG